MGARLGVTASLLLLVLGTAAPAMAAPCTATWEGGAGTWSDDDRWNPNGAPDATDDACVPSGDVTVAGAATARSLVVGASAAVAVAGTLDVGTLELEGGDVTGPGRVAVGSGGVRETSPGVARVAVAQLQAPVLEAHGGGLDVESEWDGLDAAGVLTGSVTAAGGAAVRLPRAVAQVAGTSILEVVGGATLGTQAAGAPALAGAVEVRGTLRVTDATLPVAGSLTVADGRVLLDGAATLRVSGEAVIAAGGVVTGDPGGAPRLEAGTALAVLPAGRLEGAATVAPGLALRGGEWDPFGDAQPAAGVEGAASLDGVHRVRIDGDAPGAVDRVDVAGAYTPGTIELETPAGFLPPIGARWVAATYGSWTGEGLDGLGGALLRAPAGAGPDRALVPTLGPTELVLTAVATAPPELEPLAVTLGADRRATATTALRAHGLRTGAVLEFGETTAYGGRTVVAVTGGDGDRSLLAATTPPLDAGRTYHLRVVTSSEYGDRPGADVVISVPPAEGPAMSLPGDGPIGVEPITQNVPSAPLPRVRSVGPRTFTATVLRTGGLRVRFAYRLANACTTPCRAQVQLRARGGKQRFDTLLAGDGAILFTGAVRLRRGANDLRLDIRKTRLRALRWRVAGRYRLAPVRLRVVLPQADGRELVTLRDATLRARRPAPSGR